MYPGFFFHLWGYCRIKFPAWFIFIKQKIHLSFNMLIVCCWCCCYSFTSAWKSREVGANIKLITHFNPEITIFTIICPPRIFDYPLIWSISNYNNSMIWLTLVLFTPLIGKNPSLVKFYVSISMNSSINWSIIA